MSRPDEGGRKGAGIQQAVQNAREQSSMSSGRLLCTAFQRTFAKSWHGAPLVRQVSCSRLVTSHASFHGRMVVRIVLHDSQALMAPTLRRRSP